MDKLNIEHKHDNAAKRKLIESQLVASNETLSAGEANEIVSKVNEIIDSHNAWLDSYMQVNNIGSLRNTKPAYEGQRITLLGYYSAGDKVPLNYVFKLGEYTDDGGAVIVPETINGGAWHALFPESINIRHFGAKCDNSTDDSAAWNSIALFCYDKNYEVLLEPNDISYSFEDINLYRCRKLNLRGTINLNSGKKVIIGSRANITTPDEIFLNFVTGSGIIQVQGSKNAQIKINRATKLELWADGNEPTVNSLAYCKFTLGYVPDIEINGINGGWINSNSFYCNRVRTLIIDSYDGSYVHNGNVFYNATFENSTININSGASNILMNSRLEGTNTVLFGSNSWGNTIIKVYYSSRAIYLRTASTSIDWVNNGFDNRIISWETLSHINNDFLKIDANSSNYNVNFFRKTSASNFNVLSGTVIFETDIIAVNESFGLEFLTDTNNPFLRARIILYDENKLQLSDEPADQYAVLAPGLVWDNANKWYANTSAPANLTFSIGKSTSFKYCKIIIYSSTSTNSFTYLRARERRSIHDLNSLKVISEYSNLSSKEMPISAFYPVNTFVINKGNNVNVLGWMYNGSVWMEIPKISKSNPVSDVTTADATDLTTALALVNNLKTAFNAKLQADRNSNQQSNI